MQDEWINAREASTLLFRHPRGMVSESKLRVYLQAGLVRGRAVVAELTHMKGPTVQELNWLVPRDAWKGDSNNSAFLLDLDHYSTGAFGTGFKAIKLTGLSFHSQEFLSAFGLDEPMPAANSDVGADAAALPSSAARTADNPAPSPSGSGRGRKAGVGGFAANDAVLLDEMHRMIEGGEATCAWDAARLVEVRAKGSETNRRKRLADGYKRRFAV